MRRVAIATVVCLACSAATPTGTYVVGGGPTRFEGVDAFSTAGSRVMPSTDPSAPLDVTWLTIVVAANAGACERVTGQMNGPGSTAVQVSVMHPSTDPVPPGTYALGTVSSGDPTPVASVSLVAVDASCALTAAPHLGASGTVTLARTGPDGVWGHVDVTLDDGTRLAGPFDAPGCAAASSTGSPNTFVCGP